MGLFARLRGTERPAQVQRAVAELEQRLPDGWQFVEYRLRLLCRRPVKLYAYGAIAAGPDGRRVLVVSADGYQGVLAVRGLEHAVAGRVPASPRWAPPPIRPRQKDRPPWPLADAETKEEAAARAEALALLPTGAKPMNVDYEKFGEITVYAVVAQMPNSLGWAGVGLSPAEAWRALAERLHGELAESPVWFPALPP